MWKYSTWEKFRLYESSKVIEIHCYVPLKESEANKRYKLPPVDFDYLEEIFSAPGGPSRMI